MGGGKVFAVPVLGFAACSGTGKTALLVKMLPLLKSQGLMVAMIKHAHHDFDIDKPGKDSYELRKAGADQILIASDKRLALIEERRAEPELEYLLTRLDIGNLDLILVEGFRHVAYPKIELHRPSLGNDLIYPDDENVIAVASDVDVDTGRLPLLNINSPEEIVEFVIQWMLKKNNT